MFGRLLKHQLKSTWKEFNIAYLAIIIFGFLYAIAIKSNYENFIIIMSILLILAIFSIIGLFLYFIGKLFYHSTYGKQGYLTFTLPISTHGLIISKIIATLLYLFGLMITIAITVLLFLLILDIEAVEVLIPALRIVFSKPLIFLILLLNDFISLLASLVLFQFVFALSNTFTATKKKVWSIFLLMFLIGSILGILQVFDPIDLYLIQDNNNVLKFVVATEDLIYEPILSIWYIILNIIQIVGFYFGAVYLIDKKIEIQ